MEYAEHKFYPGSTFALFKISVTFVCCGLITIAQSYAQAADEEEKTIAAPSSCKEVLFVSVPVLAYLEPLVCIAAEYAKRNPDLTITVAVPGFQDQEPPWPKVKNVRYIRFRRLGRWRMVSPRDTGSSSLGRIYAYYAHVDGLLSLHDPMLEAILRYYEGLPKPRMVVTDRYSFAGFSAAHAFDSLLVVHNPTLLFDLDVSGLAVPCPFSGLHVLPPEDVFGRFLNFCYKFVNRLVATRIVSRLNSMRKRFGLPPVKRRGDLYGDALVLSDAAPGWLDYPRQTNPAIKFLGAMLPAMDDWEGEENKDESRLLVHGDLDGAAKAVIQAAADELGYAAEFVGDSCLGPAGLAARLVQEDCASETVCQHPPVILAARVACVNAAASYGGGRPMLVWSNSTEEHVIASRISYFGLGIHVQNLTDIVRAHNHSFIVALLRELEQNKSYQSFVTKFGRALRRAGGVIQGSNLLKLVLAYGSEPFIPPQRHMAWYKRYQLDTFSVVVISFLTFLILFQAFRVAVMHLLTDFLCRCTSLLDADEDDPTLSNSISIKTKVN